MRELCKQLCTKKLMSKKAGINTADRSPDHTKKEARLERLTLKQLFQMVSTPSYLKADLHHKRR